MENLWDMFWTFWNNLGEKFTDPVKLSKLNVAELEKAIRKAKDAATPIISHPVSLRAEIVALEIKEKSLDKKITELSSLPNGKGIALAHDLKEKMADVKKTLTECRRALADAEKLSSEWIARIKMLEDELQNRETQADKIQVDAKNKKAKAKLGKSMAKINSALHAPLSPEERALKDLNERIDLYFIEIKLLNDSIGDEFISSELSEIEVTLKKIQTHLDEEAMASKTKKVEQLTNFFDYYMPTTIKILNSYSRIETQNLTGENATETKKRVEESLPFVRRAFEKELDNMFSDEMLDITTDIDVLEAVLSKEGLFGKKPIGNLKDIKNDFL